jgi:hypothetical protein
MIKLRELYNVYKVQVFIALAVLILLIAAVFIGRWYAKGQAHEFAQGLHEQWRLENQAMYDTVILNTYKLQELEKLYNEQSKTIAKLKKEREQHVDNVIKEGDPKKMAGLFDNLIDQYEIPKDFGK